MHIPYKGKIFSLTNMKRSIRPDQDKFLTRGSSSAAVLQRPPDDEWESSTDSKESLNAEPTKEYQDLLNQYQKLKKKLWKYEDNNCKLLESNNSLEEQCRALKRDRMSLQKVMNENKILIESNSILEEKYQELEMKCETQTKRIEGLLESKSKIMKKYEEIQDKLVKVEADARSKTSVIHSISRKAECLQKSESEVSVLKNQKKELEDVAMKAERLAEVVIDLSAENKKLLAEKEDADIAIKTEQAKCKKLIQRLESFKSEQRTQIDLGQQLNDANILAVGKRKRTTSLSTFAEQVSQTASHFQAKKQELLKLMETSFTQSGMKKEWISTAITREIDIEMGVFVRKIETLENLKERLEGELSVLRKRLLKEREISEANAKEIEERFIHEIERLSKENSVSQQRVTTLSECLDEKGT